MKPRRLFVLFLPFILEILMTSCPMDVGYGLSLYNNTNDTLYVVCRWDDYYTSCDTLSCDSAKYIIDDVRGNYHVPFFFSDERPDDFLRTTDTLTIFILDKEEYEGKTWSQLVDSAHFRQIYHLSGDDIRLIGTKIPYPPTEIMRNMDMVPSYEEAVR